MKLSSRKIALLFHWFFFTQKKKDANRKKHNSQRKVALAKPKDFLRLHRCFLQLIMRISLQSFQSHTPTLHSRYSSIKVLLDGKVSIDIKNDTKIRTLNLKLRHVRIHLTGQLEIQCSGGYYCTSRHCSH